MEPLYCGNHWDPSNCPDCRGVLNSGVVLYRITTIGTKQVSILERCPYFKCVHNKRFHCILIPTTTTHTLTCTNDSFCNNYWSLYSSGRICVALREEEGDHLRRDIRWSQYYSISIVTCFGELVVCWCLLLN